MGSRTQAIASGAPMPAPNPTAIGQAPTTGAIGQPPPVSQPMSSGGWNPTFAPQQGNINMPSQSGPPPWMNNPGTFNSFPMQMHQNRQFNTLPGPHLGAPPPPPGAAYAYMGAPMSQPMTPTVMPDASGMQDLMSRINAPQPATPLPQQQPQQSTGMTGSVVQPNQMVSGSMGQPQPTTPAPATPAPRPTAMSGNTGSIVNSPSAGGAGYVSGSAGGLLY
jgi:hypothetical protein